ncbi:MAG TPA: GNAT family N-acetyltransferase [Ignavibacteriaceae bacterium]|nr:GNAT family N-acetyltransferase [Ignavibacteriaceae bacterium]
MEIINLNEKYHSIYFKCLEDYSDEVKEAGNHKEIWYREFKDKGLRIKLAVEDEKVCGMIQYLPIENSFADGKDLYFIKCIWVHGHKNKGVGNCQKRGIGTALLKEAEEDVRRLNGKGMAAWGIALPIWMKASWFKKKGFKIADKNGMIALLWKPFSEDANPPKWIKEKKKPQPTEGKVTVTSFINGWCPAFNMTHERAKRASAEFGNKTIFQEISTKDKDIFNEWGISDALFVDGKQIRTGPPPSYKKIKRAIGKRVNKLKV